MICPKCGRTIPDGTQCPCSMGAPVLSSNPALNVIKTIGSSTLFLVLAILLSASALLSVFSSMGVDNVLASAYYYAANTGIDPSTIYPFLDFAESSSVVGAVIGAIPPLLIAVAVWLHFAASKNTRSGNISTAGLTICKVLTYISLISMCVLCAVIIVALIAVAAVGSVSYYGDDYGAGAAAGMAVLVVVALIGVAIFLALYVAYEVCVIKTINRIKGTAMSGTPDNRIPGFLTVMNYIFAVFVGISGLVALFSAPVAGLASLADAAALVLVSICLGNYRKQMTMLLYPPVQPVYAAPPMQGYAVPQAPVQPPLQQNTVSQPFPAPAAPVQRPAVPAEPPMETAAPSEPVSPETAPVPAEEPDPAPQEVSGDQPE